MAKKRAPKNDPFYFFEESDYDYEQSMREEFYKKDSKFKVTIFRINTVATQGTSSSSGNRHTFGERRGREKVFLPPVELTAKITAGAASFSFIGGTGITKQEYENFSFNVFLSDLEEMKVTINQGDFAMFNDGEQARFFEVKTVTTLNTTNGSRGFKPVYSKITATLVSDARIPDALKR